MGEGCQNLRGQVGPPTCRGARMLTPHDVRMLGPAFVIPASKWSSLLGAATVPTKVQDDVDQGEPGFTMGKPKLREGKFP